MARTVRQLTDLLAEGRSTGGSRVGAGGVLAGVAAGVARVDTGKGLLVEGQRTNLLLRSAEFLSAPWIVPYQFGTSGNRAALVDGAAAVAPDGSMTASFFHEGAASYGVSEHYLDQPMPSPVAAGTYTHTIFAKAASRTSVTVRPVHSGNITPGTSAVLFDLLTGSSSTASSLVKARSAVDAGGGWWRLSVTVEIPAASTYFGFRVQHYKTDGNTSYTGDGTSGIFIWGAQLEVGSFPTSYIPTTTAQVTRAADRPTLAPAASLSAWQTEKATWIVDVRDARQLDELLSFNGHTLLRGVTGSGRVVLAKTSQLTGRVYVDGVFAYEITPEMGVDMNAVGTLLLATGGQAWLRDLKCRPYVMTDTEIANLEVV